MNSIINYVVTLTGNGNTAVISEMFYGLILNKDVQSDYQSNKGLSPNFFFNIKRF